jgi:DNA-binding GntR family transcriptional regulator
MRFDILNSEFGTRPIIDMDPLPLRAPILVDQVFDRLLDAIAEGALAPGERLAQEAIAEKLQVSRQPVSHALARLRQEGLAVEQGKRGLVVAPLDAARLRALYQVRAVLDGLAARLAAEAVAAARVEALGRLDELRQTLAEGEAAAARGDRGQLIAADIAFHEILNQMAGNPVVNEITQRQWLHMRRAMGLVLTHGETRQRVWDEHAGIVEAVIAGDATSAEARARAHAERAGGEAAARLS